MPPVPLAAFYIVIVFMLLYLFLGFLDLIGPVWTRRIKLVSGNIFAIGSIVTVTWLMWNKSLLSGAILSAMLLVGGIATWRKDRFYGLWKGW